MDWKEQLDRILLAENFSYARKNPEIDTFDVYSISTLARGVSLQVYWKKHPEFHNSQKPNTDMTVGKAVHEYIQDRLYGWTKEFKIKAVYPKFTLIGHVDAIDFNNKIILEIKNTKQEKYPLKEYKLQVGAYRQIMLHEYHFAMKAVIAVIIGGRVEYHELSQDECIAGYLEILERADKVYQILHSQPKPKTLAERLAEIK